jgi:hypothetical protein
LRSASGTSRRELLPHPNGGARRSSRLRGHVRQLGPSFEPLPTGDALREYWLRELPEGERKVFEAVVGAYPGSVSREQLQALTGYKRSSTNTYLQRLSARDLVVSRGGDVVASDNLFN